MNIAIIDDEESACKVLEKLLEKIVGQDDFIKTYTSAEIALSEFRIYPPDLLFLDVEMPLMNGFQFLSELGEIQFEIIFTTAYERYAVKAIKFSAMDYILKPIDRFELEASYRRFLEGYTKKTAIDNVMKLSHLRYNLNIEDEEELKVVLSVKEGCFIIDRKDIICIEAQNNYSKFYFANRKPLLISKTLKEYDDLLKGKDFIRTHKSYLINKAHIKSIRMDGQISMTNGIICLVSRRNLPELKMMIKTV